MLHNAKGLSLLHFRISANIHTYTTRSRVTEQRNMNERITKILEVYNAPLKEIIASLLTLFLILCTSETFDNYF